MGQACSSTQFLERSGNLSCSIQTCQMLLCWMWFTRVFNVCSRADQGSSCSCDAGPPSGLLGTEVWELCSLASPFHFSAAVASHFYESGCGKVVFGCGSSGFVVYSDTASRAWAEPQFRSILNYPVPEHKQVHYSVTTGMRGSNLRRRTEAWRHKQVKQEEPSPSSSDYT